MSKSAFALRSEYAGKTEGDGVLTGASVTVAGIHFDVMEALEAGDGLIVVEGSQSALIAQLEACPVLKGVAAPENAPAIVLWKALPRLALNEEAARRGLTNYAGLSHDDLATALQLQDAMVGESDRRIHGTAHGALRDIPAALQPGVDARTLAKAQDAAAAADAAEQDAAGDTGNVADPPESEPEPEAEPEKPVRGRRGSTTTNGS